jgi:hypothetical protein
MSEEHARQVPAESGDENASDTIKEATTGAEEADPAKGTPPIDGSGQRPGQTQTPLRRTTSASLRSSRTARSSCGNLAGSSRIHLQRNCP